MKAKRVAVAVDVGSRSTKVAAVCRQEDGSEQVLATAQSEYEAQHGARGMVKQDAETWYTAFVDALEQVLRKLDPALHRVSEIVLSGQMQCVVCVDGGRPLMPAILYSDTRATEEAAELTKIFGGADKIAALTGNFKGAASCMAKALWLSRRKAAVLTIARHVLFGAHSFVAWRLTGRAACDRTTAQTTSFSNKNADAWCADIFEQGPRELAGDWKRLMPDLVAVNEPLATLEKGLMGISGLDSTLAATFGATPVAIYHGPGDLGTTTLGAATVRARAEAEGGRVSKNYIYIGTSGWIARCEPDNANAAEGANDGVFRIAHPRSGMQIVASPMTTCGGNVEWIRAMLRDPSGDNTAYAKLDALAGSCDPGANGVLYLPHPNGERAPLQNPHARAAMVGISGETTQAHLARAVLEGVAFHLRWLAEAGHMFADADEAVVVVGGGARSTVWCQILATVLGRPVVVNKTESIDTAVLGAASCVTTDEEPSAAAAKDLVKRFEPEDFSYSALYTAWRAVYDALQGPYAELQKVA
ncbi:Xylulose kinase [Hondaea fermentalgiana]|uniref:glycerol kinase n=1 Tax=Hondaea fermentalgiana TaxID=2315210 RepID=A0A2R5GIY1_9STRA|nr:Xylulose kinase [Hondaea fermentalgiana]|eukprot:GBG30846.1 Xylulose kinase [Hondaea fermentalgiana]